MFNSEINRAPGVPKIQKSVRGLLGRQYPGRKFRVIRVGDRIDVQWRVDEPAASPEMGEVVALVRPWVAQRNSSVIVGFGRSYTIR